MDPCEVSALMTTLACQLSKDRDTEEVLHMASLCSQLNDALRGIAANRIFCEKMEKRRTAQEAAEEAAEEVAAEG